MKKRILKKSIVLLLAISMIFGVAGCGQKKNNTDKQKMSEADKDSIYTYEIMDWDEETKENMGSLQFTNEYMYGTYYEYDDETYESTTHFGLYDLEGKEVATFVAPSGYDETSSYGVNQFAVANKDEIYGLKFEYTSGVDETTGEYSWNEFYSLVKFDGQGNEIWTVSLGSSGDQQEEYYSVNNLMCDNSGNVWIFDDNAYTCYDKDGNKGISIKALENSAGNVWINEDNNFIVGQWDDEWTTVQFFEVDTKSGKVIDSPLEIPGSYYQYSFYSGAGSQWDMYATNSVGVWAFNWGDSEMTKVMDFILSDFEGTSLYNVRSIADNQFIASYYDVDWNYEVATFTKVPKEDVVDRYIMNLACYYIDTEVRKQVIEFNRSHEDVRIMLTDYSSLDSEENEWEGGMNALNEDILSGKVPDILIAPSGFDMGMNANKGLFTDLYKLMEQDDSIDMEDYLQNIIALGEYNGELYELIPRFNAVTLIGKTADVGDGFSWTYDDMNALLAKKGDNVNLFTLDNSRLSVMNYGINLAFDQFYNGNTGECYFNTPEFIQFLELVKTYPEEVDGTIYDSEDFWINYENQWRNGETILKYEWVSNFMNYVENSQGYFGESVSYIGFPTTEGSGSAAYANFSMAISEESAFKEEAWDFISYFMKDEYQDKVTYEFPIKLSSLNKKAEEERTPETWIDEETGEEIVETPSYWLGEEEIELKMPTEEECQYVIEFLKNIDYRQKQIEEIKAIIEEDSAAFFEGEKSAQQVADTIQSRVKIYVSEKR